MGRAPKVTVAKGNREKDVCECVRGLGEKTFKEFVQLMQR